MGDISKVLGDRNALERVLADAVHDVRRGEARLLEILERVPLGTRPRVIAALGEATGNAGTEKVRTIALDKAATTDMRTAAVVALTKRAGVHASPTLSLCLRDTNEFVRQYAMLGMAVSGDGRDDFYVLDMLKSYLETEEPLSADRRTLSLQSTLIPMIVYLARHGDTRRRQEVAELIRARSDKVGAAETEWLTVYWPACVTTDTTGIEPDPAQMMHWQRAPMFTPRYGRQQQRGQA